MSLVFAFDALVLAPKDQVNEAVRHFYLEMTGQVDTSEGDVLSQPRVIKATPWGLDGMGQTKGFGGVLQTDMSFDFVPIMAGMKNVSERLPAGALFVLAYLESNQEGCGVLAATHGQPIVRQRFRAHEVFAMAAHDKGWADRWEGDDWGPELLRAWATTVKGQRVLAPWVARKEAKVLERAVPTTARSKQRGPRL